MNENKQDILFQQFLQKLSDPKFYAVRSLVNFHAPKIDVVTMKKFLPAKVTYASSMIDLDTLELFTEYLNIHIYYVKLINEEVEKCNQERLNTTIP
jgi:hypothetical protein